MKKTHPKQAIIIMGNPGSGKSTQASLIAEKLQLRHINTGRILEHTVHNPKLQKDRLIQKEKQLFDKGFLLDPPFALSVITKATQDAAEQGDGVVFSGSPRTLYEALGEKNVPGLIQTLLELYGKNNIFVFHINVSEKEAFIRNSQRLVCSSCDTPVLIKMFTQKPKGCPLCGGKLYKRTLDDKDVIKKRFQEYRERTEPVLKSFKEKKIAVNEIDGTKLPFKVFQSIILKIPE